MFDKYFLIYYENLPLTLAKFGVTMENWEKMENKPTIYPEIKCFTTRCNKKQLVNLVSMINKHKGIKVEQVLKVGRHFFQYGEFVPYCVIENRLTASLNRHT